MQTTRGEVLVNFVCRDHESARQESLRGGGDEIEDQGDEPEDDGSTEYQRENYQAFLFNV